MAMKDSVFGIDRSKAGEYGLRWEPLAEMGSKDVMITLLKEKGGLRWAMRGGSGEGGVNLKGER
jgi:hypothetical protein